VPVAPAPRRTTTVERPSPSPAPAHPALTLIAARGNCWLSVTTVASGKAVYQGTLLQGEKVRFGLRRPLTIRVGAPWNLDAHIGARAVTSSLPTVTANVLATAKGLKITS
jgi:RodZ C-terminal domain